ncbi:unnamed protein product [Amoebophrya sp. A120]|nr:unnamed protein product [Amoebophrya sp. A120]|eukprot:GSA120T00003430001.1
MQKRSTMSIGGRVKEALVLLCAATGSFSPESCQIAHAFTFSRIALEKGKKRKARIISVSKTGHEKHDVGDSPHQPEHQGREHPGSEQEEFREPSSPEVDVANLSLLKESTSNDLQKMEEQEGPVDNETLNPEEVVGSEDIQLQRVRDERGETSQLELGERESTNAGNVSQKETSLSEDQDRKDVALTHLDAAPETQRTEQSTTEDEDQHFFQALDHVADERQKSTSEEKAQFFAFASSWFQFSVQSAAAIKARVTRLVVTGQHEEQSETHSQHQKHGEKKEESGRVEEMKQKNTKGGSATAALTRESEVAGPAETGPAGGNKEEKNSSQPPADEGLSRGCICFLICCGIFVVFAALVLGLQSITPASAGTAAAGSFGSGVASLPSGDSSREPKLGSGQEGTTSSLAIYAAAANRSGRGKAPAAAATADSPKAEGNKGPQRKTVQERRKTLAQVHAKKNFWGGGSNASPLM